MKLGISWFVGFMKLGIKLQDLQDLIRARFQFHKEYKCQSRVRGKANPKVGAWNFPEDQYG